MNIFRIHSYEYTNFGLVAIVVPEEKMLLDWYEAELGKRPDFVTACADKRSNKFMLTQMQSIGKENKLNAIEQASS